MPVNQNHFLDLKDLSGSALRKILKQATEMKSHREDGYKPLSGKTLAMIFEKPSTRTRVSFEVGMKELGGDVVVLSGDELQAARGESTADTARRLQIFGVDNTRCPLGFKISTRKDMYSTILMDNYK